MTRIIIESRSGAHSAECDAELFAHAEKVLGEESARWALWNGGEDRLRQRTEKESQRQTAVEESRRETNCPNCAEEKIKCDGCGLFKCAQCEIDDSKSYESAWYCADCVAKGEHQNTCDACSESFDLDELRGIPAPWGAIDLCNECKHAYYRRSSGGFFSAASRENFYAERRHARHETIDENCEICREENPEEMEET